MGSLAPQAAALQRRKRLIVVCDGTWEDSTSDSLSAYPTNVTRLSRALSAYGTEKKADGTEDQIEQIIYYVKGVGTGTLDHLIGGATGLGLSANVREAYGFLAHNYQEGDSIYFFGFSRGAYTARAIAGLVTDGGLLTKKGMDSFSKLYDLFYRQQSPEAEKNKEKVHAFYQALSDNGLLVTAAREAVEIVGVFETVAFHQTWMSKLGLAKLLGLSDERIEFRNAELSPRVKYGFHALALDETRRAYLPTLWHTPKDVAEGDMRLKELTQVWFSGGHGDVGGGRTDHRLSDVSLAWMIAKCKATGLLSFSDDYLIDGTSPPLPANPYKEPWSVAKGATKTGDNLFWTIVDGITRNVPGISVTRTVLSSDDTRESIHSSIADRKFGDHSGAPGAKTYSCRALNGKTEYKGTIRQWQSSKGTGALPEIPPMELEEIYKGRIRSAYNPCVKTMNA